MSWYPASMLKQIFCEQTPLPTLGMGSIGQNSAFSERGHVAYQIKENQECTKMVANILPADSYPSQARPCGLGQ